MVRMLREADLTSGTVHGISEQTIYKKCEGPDANTLAQISPEPTP